MRIPKDSKRKAGNDFMNREKEFIKNTIVLGIGRFFPYLLTFITLPILTEKLSKTEYGTYDLISTLVLLVIPVATLQIQSAAFRFLIDYREDRKKSSEIISNIYIITIPISLLASFAVQFFFSELGTGIQLLIASYFFTDTLYLTMGQVVRGLGDNRNYSIAAIVFSSINMTGIVLLLQVNNRGLPGVLASLTVANTIATVYLIVKCKIGGYLSFKYISGSQIKRMMSYSWPMLPNNLSTWVLKLSDRLIITAYLGIEANAVYAVANKVPNVLSLAQSIMVMAWHENASVAAKDKDAGKYYSQMLEFCFDFMAGFTALLIAATPILFKLLIKGNYAEAYYQMPLLILAMFFFTMSSFFGGIYIAFKKTANVGVSTMAAAAVNLTIDILLVKVIGITAGSVSTLVAYILLYYYRMHDVQKFQVVKCNRLKQFIQITVIVGMLILFYLQKWYLNILNIALGIGTFLVFNKAIFAWGIRYLKKKIRK